MAPPVVAFPSATAALALASLKFLFFFLLIQFLISLTIPGTALYMESIQEKVLS